MDKHLLKRQIEKALHGPDGLSRKDASWAVSVIWPLLAGRLSSEHRMQRLFALVACTAIAFIAGVACGSKLYRLGLWHV